MNEKEWEGWEKYHNEAIEKKDRRIMEWEMYASGRETLIEYKNKEIAELRKHDCEKWFEEAAGCAICSNLLLKSPIKTLEELREVALASNAHISYKDREIAELKAECESQSDMVCARECYIEELEKKLDNLPSEEEIINILMKDKQIQKDLNNIHMTNHRNEAYASISKTIHNRINKGKE